MIINKPKQFSKPKKLYKLTSINEGVEVDFDETNHTYSFKGKRLMCPSEYIKTLYKEFDLHLFATMSAKSWNVNVEDVKAMWESSGDCAREFGTVVHKTIEHWLRFENVGKTISTKQQKEGNYALPKHPFLLNILTEFNKIQKPVGENYPESLITDIEGGTCGKTDNILVLDWDKKVCRLWDYKINIGSEDVESSLKVKEPFDKLPANKLTKYQIQLSFYANMLQKSGWVVEGLDVFVLENEWKHYKLEVLQVLK
jgi:hypothetical protein